MVWAEILVIWYFLVVFGGGSAYNRKELEKNGHSVFERKDVNESEKNSSSHFWRAIL